MRHALKILILRVVKAFGGFRISRWFTRREIRILGYHGISIGDQHEFEPLLFMRAATFARRLKTLTDDGWRVVDLDTAVRELRNNTIKDNTLVITIDDGWVSTAREAAPLLEQHKLPATLYVTTYYAERRAEVFNVALYYLAWKTKCEDVALATGYSGLDGPYRIKPDWIAAARKWIDWGNANLTSQQRQDLLAKIAAALEVDPSESFSADRFRIVDEAQVKELHARGIDIQLHTHRHNLPGSSYEALRAEILDNKQRLEAWTGKVCDHFCYPSGIYTLEQSEWLGQMGLASSTTCDKGNNGAGTHPHRLRRILDRESWSDLEFEAVTSGFTAIFGRFSATAPPRE